MLSFDAAARGCQQDGGRAAESDVYRREDDVSAPAKPNFLDDRAQRALHGLLHAVPHGHSLCCDAVYLGVEAGAFVCGSVGHRAVERVVRRRQFSAQGEIAHEVAEFLRLRLAVPGKQGRQFVEPLVRQVLELPGGDAVSVLEGGALGRVRRERVVCGQEDGREGERGDRPRFSDAANRSNDRLSPGCFVRQRLRPVQGPSIVHCATFRFPPLQMFAGRRGFQSLVRVRASGRARVSVEFCRVLSDPTDREFGIGCWGARRLGVE